MSGYNSYSSGYQVPSGGTFGASFSSPKKDYGGSYSQPTTSYSQPTTSYSYNTSTGTTGGFPSSLSKPTTTTTTNSYSYTSPSAGTYGTSGYGTAGGYSGLGGSYSTNTGLGYGGSGMGYGQTQPSGGSGFGGAFGTTQPSAGLSYGYGTTTPGSGMGAGQTQPGGYASTSYSQPSTSSYGLSSYGQPSTTQPGSYAQPSGYAQPTSNYGSYGVTPTPGTGKALGKDELDDLSKAGKQLFSNAFSKTSTQSGYDEVLKQLKSSGQQYRDLDFPPELRSLTGGMSDRELQENYIQVDMKSILWRRAEEIYGKGNFKVFQNSIEPGDIQQGALGDCYFLSTIAAIAENPERIKKIFKSQEPNDQGIYAIEICDMGVWTTVLLDDYIPCSGKSKKPIFTDTNGPELWVALLEKAWAKTYGSYARIDAGLTRECLHDLTGAPTKYYLTGDVRRNEEIWTEISNGEKKNYVMTCGSGDLMDGADLMSSVGLVGSHAYSLLAALTVKDKYGKDVRLVKIRNPWGQGEWKGEWSDQSASWTPELRRQLQMENRDDGTFFMSYDDMLKYYTDIQICKVHDDFIYKSLKSSCNHVHAAFFKLTVKKSGHYYITINQESTRKHAEKENYRYSKVRVVFGKKVGDGYQYVEGITKADKEVWTDGHMEAGEYIVYAKIAWNEQKTKEFSISSYGAGDVEIEKIDESQCPGFIEKVYTNKGRTIKLGDYSSHGVNNCFRGMELTDDGFGFVYYKNESNKTLEEDFYFKVMNGFVLKKPHKGNSFKITVPPGQERVVILKQLPNAAGMSHSSSAISKFV